MPESLLIVFKLCVLALLYLFFLRVLRAVWAEVKGPAVAVPTGGRGAPGAGTRRTRRDRRPARGRGVPQLVIVDPEAQRGRAYPMAEEMTVGRAAGCQVPIDDTYASQIHARVFQREGQVYVEDLGSTNGTYLNRKKVSGPMIMRRGDRLQVGQTVLELR